MASLHSLRRWEPIAALLFSLGIGVAPPAIAGDDARVAKTSPATTTPASATAAGDFTLLTYNVAGLPFLVSESEPWLNMPAIGGLLNLYDVAVVQEDFAYHTALAAGALHPFRSEALVPSEKVGIGDGLNTFSRTAFARFERVTWKTCNGRFSDGADCFAPKGFSVETHTLAPGVEFDLYNLHMDSGHAARDIQARAAQAAQLADFIDRRSEGRAVIVAGDTNMDGDSESILTSFLRRTGLSDACRSLGCATPERIDRVLYRSAKALTFTALRFEVDRRFVRADGQDLSDHEAVGVTFHWETADKTRVARAQIPAARRL